MKKKSKKITKNKVGKSKHYLYSIIIIVESLVVKEASSPFEAIKNSSKLCNVNPLCKFRSQIDNFV